MVKKKESLGKIKIQKLNAVRAVLQGVPKNASLVSKGKTGYIQEEMIKEAKWLS